MPARLSHDGGSQTPRHCREPLSTSAVDDDVSFAEPERQAMGGVIRSGANGLPPPTCPQCEGALYRVRRHLGDRLLSLFTARRRPRLRYECRMPGCGWRGCLVRPLG